MAKKCNINPVLVKELVKKWIFEIPLLYIKKCKKRGIKKLFNKIKENNIKIAIYSDYPAKSKLEILDLPTDLIVSSTDPVINRFKPNSRALYFIAENFDCDLSQCVLIGDRQEKDGKCAISVNMQYIIVQLFFCLILL